MVLEHVTDPAYVKEQIALLLWHDPDISADKKKQLSEKEESADEFIAGCMLYGMIRKFIPKSGTSKEKKTFSLSEYLLYYHFPSVNRVFFGRDEELNEIHNRLYQNPCLFIEGIGGIGKSEIARQYGRRYKAEYEHVIFLRYKNNLKQTIAELDFVDDHPDMDAETLFNNHYRFFKRLKSDTLVILDNFDTVTEKEELFHAFVSLSFTLLVTTRSHITEALCYMIGEIKDNRELLGLFDAYAPVRDSDADTALKIIEEVNRHTLTVEMAAKTLTASGISFEALLSALQDEGIALSNRNKIKVVKDNRTKKNRLHGHIVTLFTIQNLSRVNQDILMNMTLIPAGGLPKSLFREWIQAEDLNPVNELIDYGWIQQDIENNQISLHPFIHEVLVDITEPSIAKCATFATSVFTICEYVGADIPEFRHVLNTIESMFRCIQVDGVLEEYYILDRALAYLVKYHEFDKMDRLLDLMRGIIPVDEGENAQWATYYCYKGAKEYSKGNIRKSIDCYNKGIERLNPLQPDIKNVPALMNLYNNLSNSYKEIDNSTGNAGGGRPITKLWYDCRRNIYGNGNSETL